MIKELQYPFDAEYILTKKKSIRRKLLAEPVSRMKKGLPFLEVRLQVILS